MKILLLVHEQAYEDQASAIQTLRAHGVQLVEIPERDLPLADAVTSYFFNSQIVNLPSGGMVCLAPEECRVNSYAAAVLTRLVADDAVPIERVDYVPLTQSMQNGGGPACLRLRLPLTEAQWAAVHPGIRINDALLAKLASWVTNHYRQRLSMDDLRDPSLAVEARTAYAALEEILDLKGLYDAFD